MDVSTGLHESTDHIHVGGKSRGTMGISDSAEFYHLLSDALYSHKELAVIREILCNGWDAHIDAGITDRPLKITYDDTDGMMHLTIRDFGKGIPNDQLVEIYGTYGNSTKRKKDLETGGFGLGSKSPFAVTGHFNVDNYHDGKKTLYKILKEGANDEGKPDVLELASVPSDETGIAVKIPIKDHQQLRLFRDLVNMISYLGGIKITTGNQEHADANYPTLPWDTAPYNYMAVKTDNQHMNKYAMMIGQGNLWVKLGAVLYPVNLNDPKLSKVAQLTRQAMTQISDGDSYYLIVNVPGGSLKVTPSRESLSYNNTTMENIELYCGKALRHLIAKRQGTFNKSIQELKKDFTSPQQALYYVENYKGSYHRPHYDVVYSDNAFDKLHFNVMLRGFSSERIVKKMFPISLKKNSWEVSKPRSPVPFGHRRRMNLATATTQERLNNKLLKNLVKVFGNQKIFKRAYRMNCTDNSNLYYDKTVRIRSDRMVFIPTIVVGYTIKAIEEMDLELDFFNLPKEHLMNVPRSYHGRSDVLTFIRHPKDELDEEKLQEAAKKYGIKVIFQEKPAPVQRVVTPRVKVPPLTHVTGFSLLKEDVMIQGNGNVTPHKKQQIPLDQLKDYYYVEMRSHTRDYNAYAFNKNYAGYITQLAKLEGVKLVGMHASETRELYKKHGAKPVEELIEKVLKNVHKNQAVLLMLIRKGESDKLIDDTFGSKLQRLYEIAMYSPKLLKTFFGISFKKQKDLVEADLLADIIQSMRGMATDDDNRYKEIIKKFQETQSKILTALSETSHKYDRGRDLDLLKFFDMNELIFSLSGERYSQNSFKYSVIENTPEVIKRIENLLLHSHKLYGKK